MTLRTSFALLGAAAALLASMAQAGPLDKTECIAPAKPGGGFDLTCKLAQGALHEMRRDEPASRGALQAVRRTAGFRIGREAHDGFRQAFRP